jgi:hypothetical protein
VLRANRLRHHLQAVWGLQRPVQDRNREKATVSIHTFH